MSPRAKEILEATGQIQVVVDNDKATNDPKVLAGLIGEFDGLGVRSGTKVTAAVLEKAGKLKKINFTDRAAMKKAVDPVMAAYAKEVDADAIYTKINALQ